MAIPTLSQGSTVGIQPGPTVSGAAPFDTLTNMFENFQSQVQQKVQQIGVQAAAQKGAESGASGSQKMALPLTAAGQAFNKAATYANNQLVTNAAMNFATQAYAPYHNAVTGPETIQSYQQGFAKGAQQILNQALPQNRASVEAVLNNQMTKGTAALQTVLNQQTKAATGVIAQQNINSYISQGVQAAQNNNLPQAQAWIGKLPQMLVPLVQKGLVSQSGADTTINGAISATNQAGYVSEYMASKDKAGVINNLMNDPNIPAQDRASILNKIRTQINAQNQLTGNTTQNRQQQISNYLFTLRNGGSRNPALEAQMLASDPNAERDQADFGIADQMGSQLNLAKSMSLPDLEGQITKLQNQISLPATTGADPSLLNTYNKAQLTQLQSLKSQLINNPSVVITNSPAYQQGVQKLKAQIFTGPVDPNNPESAAQVAKFQQGTDNLLYNLQIQRGIKPGNVQMLLPQQANEMATQLASQSVPEQVQTLLSWQKQHGQYAPLVFKQMGKNIPANALIATQVLNDPNTAGAATDVLNAFSESTANLKAAVQGHFTDQDINTMNQQIVQKLAPYTDQIAKLEGDTTTPIDQIYAATKQYGLYLMQKYPNISVDQIAKQATNTLFFDHYQTVNLNGTTTYIPKSVNYQGQTMQIPGATVNEAAQALYRTAINNGDALSIPTYAGTKLAWVPEEFKKAYYLHTLYNASVRIRPDDSGLELADEKGNVVYTKNGTPFQFKYTDLFNPKSAINKAMATQNTMKGALTAHINMALSPIDFISQAAGMTGNV